MKKQYLMVREADSVIVGCLLQDDPDAGPLQRPQSPTPDGITLVDYEDEFTRAPYADAYQARYVAGAVLWIDTQAMAVAIDAAVAQCYRDIDAIYADAIGNRVTEYTDAETDARAFAAAGFLGEAPVTIACFARYNPTGQVQTDRWAAEQTIACADAFRAAQLAMRTQRFESQAAMRACATPADLAHVLYLWDEFIAALRLQLEL